MQIKPSAAIFFNLFQFIFYFFEKFHMSYTFAFQNNCLFKNTHALYLIVLDTNLDHK